MGIMMRQSPKGFVISLLAVFSAGLLAVLLANLIVDPFRRFELVTIPDINAQRPEFSGNSRMAKAGVVCRLKPEAVILGSSRAEVALDPRHPGFGSQTTYNLALSGIGIGEMEKTLRHTVYASPQLELAVIALDFLMFNAHREAVVFQTEVVDFDAARLLLTPERSCISSFSHDANRLVGFVGLRHVAKTVWSQKPEAAMKLVETQHEAAWWCAQYDALGFRGNTYVVLDILNKRNGQRVFYANDSSGQEIYYARKIWRAGPQQRYCFSAPGQPNTFEVFRKMIRFARQAGLDVRFVINPMHARMLLAIQEAGLWPQYEEWKRELVVALSDEAVESGTPPYQLWDFSGFNSITTEACPPEKDTHVMSRWFWEPSHMRRETGDLVLDRVLGHSDANRRVPSDFGAQLDASSIEQWIEETRCLGRKYIATHPAEVANLKRRLAPLFDGWTGANCGEELSLIDKAALLVRQGQPERANELLADAQAIQTRDRQRAAELGVPYREPDIGPLVAAARKGIAVEYPLANWQAYQDRGNERVAKGELEAAVKDFTRAIKLAPPNPALHYLRGQARCQLKDYLGAVEDYSAGLMIDDKNVTLLMLRGQAKAQLGDDAGAAQDYAVGLKLDPGNSTFKSLLDQARARIALGNQ